MFGGDKKLRLGKNGALVNQIKKNDKYRADTELKNALSASSTTQTTGNNKGGTHANIVFSDCTTNMMRQQNE